MGSGQGEHLVKVHKLVIICLHYKLRLLTELRHPEVAHDGLVAGVDARTIIQLIKLDWGLIRSSLRDN